MMDFIITESGILHKAKLNAMQSNSDNSVYEVIRIVDGIALFLEDHFARLIASVKINGFHFEMERSEFEQNIADLTRLNQTENGNVKFVLSEFEMVNHWSFFFIPHSYPEPNDYTKGVATGLLPAERENPNAKVIQNAVRERANQMISEEKLYEALLVDRNGKITEGSRSNVFFVKENRFYTAPETMVLVGITRQKVFECLNELAFPIIENAVSASEISDFDAVFLTGTSPKVLPVNCIGEIPFSVNNFFVSQLIEKYNLVINRYLNDRIKLT